MGETLEECVGDLELTSMEFLTLDSAIPAYRQAGAIRIQTGNHPGREIGLQGKEIFKNNWSK